MSKKDSAYLQYLRTLPCSRCRHSGPSVAHHIIDEGLLPGMGSKAPDLLAMPLCPNCHAELHKGWHQEQQAHWLVQTLYRASSDGIL